MFILYMNILKKVILKYINDKDIGYSILSALGRLQTQESKYYKYKDFILNIIN
jgi:ACT domain-containing protein